MLLSHTCIFVLIVSLSLTITCNLTKHTTSGYQTLAAKTDSRRQNVPERKVNINAENGNKGFSQSQQLKFTTS
ncbi:hypothetical protein QUF74_14380 [Candidatus Halobeggiatoa sp. HSG11]|nr:hypothetical protein [Candidatus Halobeggiatoa sp. HSG11]